MDATSTAVDAPVARLPRSEDKPLMRVEEAGAYLNLRRAASYDAVRRGEIPVLRVGNRLWVPTARFRAVLGLES